MEVNGLGKITRSMVDILDDKPGVIVLYGPLLEGCRMQNQILTLPWFCTVS